MLIHSYIWFPIVGNQSTFLRYTPYVPWAIRLAKYRFHEYAGRGDESSSNEIACYNEILFNNNDVILGLSYLK